MPIYLVVQLSDLEYRVLKNLKTVRGEGGNRLRDLLNLYISTVPELRPQYYALKRDENRRELEEILYAVWDAYENTDDPIDSWSEDKINMLIGALIEINALVEIVNSQFMPANKFRSLFKTLLHDIATENRGMDEYSAACVATIQLLMEFGHGVLSKDIIIDGTIFINENWMFPYAAAMKRAREFIRTRKLFPEIVPEVAVSVSEPG